MEQEVGCAGGMAGVDRDHIGQGWDESSLWEWAGVKGTWGQGLVNAIDSSTVSELWSMAGRGSLSLGLQHQSTAELTEHLPEGKRQRVGAEHTFKASLNPQ